MRLHHEVASSGTRWSSCKPVMLATLGGCYLLDGLVVVSGEELCEGHYAHPMGATKSNSS